MSFTMSLVTTVNDTVLPFASEIVANECSETDPGLFGWACKTSNSTGTIVRSVAVVAAMIFVLYQGFQSKGAIGRIIVSGLAAAIFVWIIFNVTDLSEETGDNLPGAVAAIASPGKLPDQGAP